MDFRNAIIVMTSNIGAEMIKRQGGFGFEMKRSKELDEKLTYEDMRKKLLDALKRVFRPEFINRLDSVIVFRSLNKEDIQKIVELELAKVSLRLVEHDLTLSATAGALGILAELGYDPDMGARPLRRVIQQKVEDPLSDGLLSGDFQDGDAIRIVVDGDDVKLKRTKRKKKVVAAPPPEEELAAA